MLLLLAVFISTALLLKPKPHLWLPMIPMIILVGGRQIEMYQFFPTHLTLLIFGFYIFYAVDRIIWNRPSGPRPFPLKLILVAFFIQLASIAISIHVHGQYFWNAVREGSGLFLFMPLVFIIPDLCKDDEALKRLGRALVVALLISSAYGVIQYTLISGFSKTDISIGYIYRGRVASFLGNPNVFAGYLELSIPIAITLGIWEKQLKWKVITFTAVILGILSVLYTFSRGGLGALTFGCGIALVLYFRKKLWVPILIVVIFIGTLIGFADVFERQMSFFTNPSELSYQPTLLHRYVTYKSLLSQFAEEPLTGVGWGAQSFFFGRSMLYSFWEIRHTVSTEPIKLFGGLNSLLLTHAVRGGLIGLSALFLVLVSAVMLVFRAFKRVPFPWGIGLIGSLAGFFTHQIMDNFLQWEQTGCMFWLLLGISVAAVRIQSGNEKSFTEKTDSLESIPVK